MPVLWCPPPQRPALILGDTESTRWVQSSAFSALDSTKHLFLSCLLPPICALPPSSDFDCSDPLGMESGEITSDQIMASSQYNPSWSPERSRLNYYENAWTPAEDSNKEWIQVQLCFSCHGGIMRLLGSFLDLCITGYCLESWRISDNVFANCLQCVFGGESQSVL